MRAADVARPADGGTSHPGVTPTAEGPPYSGFVNQRTPGYTALRPSRMFDTRASGTRCPAVGVPVPVPRLPAAATAVAMNVTVTETSAPGYVSAYPCGAKTPEVSNVNFTGPGQTVPNFAIVSLGADHDVCFFASTGTHLLADLSGYLPSISGRLGPTGAGTLVRHTQHGRGGRRNGAGEDVPHLRRHLGPVVMNVTITQPDQPGYATVYPCDAVRPEVSNLNYMPGQTAVPNLVTVRLPADGRLCFYSSANGPTCSPTSPAHTPPRPTSGSSTRNRGTCSTRKPAGSPPLDGLAEYSIEIGDPAVEAAGVEHDGDADVGARISSRCTPAAAPLLRPHPT